MESPSPGRSAGPRGVRGTLDPPSGRRTPDFHQRPGLNFFFCSRQTGIRCTNQYQVYGPKQKVFLAIITGVDFPNPTFYGGPIPILGHAGRVTRLGPYAHTGRIIRSVPYPHRTHYKVGALRWHGSVVRVQLCAWSVPLESPLNYLSNGSRYIAEASTVRVPPPCRGNWSSKGSDVVPTTQSA